MNRQENLTSSAQILDITIATVFWSSRYGSRALRPDLCLDVIAAFSNMHVDWLWWIGDHTIGHGMLASRYQFRFTVIPRLENLRGRCTAENSRMDEAGEANVWNAVNQTVR
jgi:hypothetical protein